MTQQLKENDLPDFLRELRGLLSQIAGVKGYTETVSFSYVCLVENEESKLNVEKVANILTKQAAQEYNLDLEIIPATQQEVDEVSRKFEEHQKQKAKAPPSFKIDN